MLLVRRLLGHTGSESVCLKKQADPSALFGANVKRYCSDVINLIPDASWTLGMLSA